MGDYDIEDDFNSFSIKIGENIDYFNINLGDIEQSPDYCSDFLWHKEIREDHKKRYNK